MTTSEASSREDEGQKQQGLLGSLFGGKKVAKAKLGLDMQMYYNEELKCWVMPGEEEEKKKEMEGLRAPPQMPVSSSSMSGQQPSMGAGQSVMGAGQSVSSLSSRYAAMPTMSVGGGPQQQGSILAGLKPPPLGGGGAGMAQQPFKPMAVFNPSSSGDTERNDTTSIWQQQTREEQKPGEEETPLEEQKSSETDTIDPLVLEVLSFWLHYRGCGYDVDVMKEWVCENYSEEVSSQLDCEALLKDEGIASAVQVYMEQHKQHDEDVPVSPQEAGGALDQYIEEPQYVEEEPHQEQYAEHAQMYEQATQGEQQYEGTVEEMYHQQGEYNNESYHHQDQYTLDESYQYKDESYQQHDEHDQGGEYATMAEPEDGLEAEQGVSVSHNEKDIHTEYDTYHYSASHAETVDQHTEMYPPAEGGYVTPAVGASPEKEEQPELNEFGLPVPTAYPQEQEQGVMYTNNVMFDESAQGWDASPGSVGTLSSHEETGAMLENVPPPVEHQPVQTEYENTHMSNVPIPSGIIDSAEVGGYEEAPQDTVLASRKTLQELEDLRMALQQANSSIEEKTEELERMQTSMDTAIEEKNVTIAELEEALDGVRAEVTALQAELHGQLASTQETEERQEVEVAELKQHIFDLEGECEDLKSRIQSLERESEELQDARQQIQHLSEQLEDVAKHEDILKQLEAEKEMLVAQVDSIKGDSSSELQKLLQEKETLEDSLREEMASIQNDFQSMLDERDAEIMQLEARVMLSENAVQTAKDEARAEVTAEVHASFEEDKAELEALLETKEVELADYLHRVQEQEKKFAAAKKKIQVQGSQIDKLSEEMEALREKADSGDSAREQVESIAEECNELKVFIETLEQRMEDAEVVHSKEIESLVQENNQLMDALSEKEDHLDQMNAEIAQLRSTLEQAQSLESQVSHWEEAASAAQDALMAEKEAKDMAQAQYAELEQRVHEMTQSLNEAHAQTQHVAQLQSDLEHKHEQILALHQKCEEYEIRLQSANMTIENAQAEIEELSRVLQENPPGANEELESEINLLRHQLAAHSEGASHKEEELRKYKLQLVKAKKLRAHDQERIEELLELQEEYESKLQAAAEAMNSESDATIQMSSLQQELADAKAESQEHEESLNDALTALGQEEAKVSRLVELLSMAGLTEDEIQQELDAVTEEVGYDIL